MPRFKILKAHPVRVEFWDQNVVTKCTDKAYLFKNLCICLVLQREVNFYQDISLAKCHHCIDWMSIWNLSNYRYWYKLLVGLLYHNQHPKIQFQPHATFQKQLGKPMGSRYHQSKCFGPSCLQHKSKRRNWKENVFKLVANAFSWMILRKCKYLYVKTLILVF